MPVNQSPTSTVALPAVRSAARQSRARRSAAPLAVQIGKHFARVTEANASLAVVIDQGFEIELDREAGRPVQDDSDWIVRCFQMILCMYDTMKIPDAPRLLESLRDPLTGLQFRNEFCNSLQSGRSTARTDDTIALRDNIRDWPNTPINGVKILGWGDAECAKLLSTQSMDMNNKELIEQLRDSIAEAPHDDLFLALFDEYRFPNDPAYPLAGFGRSNIFVYTLMTIFVGPGSVFSRRSGGSRGKGAKNGMVALTKESLAYAAMVLRFVLRNSGSWYKIANEAIDTRYNYDRFYVEVLELLEDPLFKDEVDELLTDLNIKVFPHCHASRRRIRSNGSNMRQRVADARATRQARVAGENSSAGNNNANGAPAV